MTTQTLVGTHAPDALSQPLIERFLRDRATVWQQLHDRRALPALLRAMLALSLGSLSAYGLVMGLSHSAAQALVSAVKLPVLYLLTLAICLPTLHFFNLLRGGQLTLLQIIALALSGIAVPSALLLAFAPVTLFFLLTAQDYSFFVLLNVAILALTSLIGMRLVLEGAGILNGPALAGEEGQEVRSPMAVDPTLLRLWLGLYAIVGTQLAASLSPFFGDPSQPFQLFHPVGSFYSAIMQHLLWW